MCYSSSLILLVLCSMTTTSNIILIYIKYSYDFTGSAFVRHFLYEFCGPNPATCSYRQYLGDSFNSGLYAQNVKYAFQMLLELDQYVYVDPVLGKYPTKNDAVDDLFAKETIWIVSNSHISRSIDIYIYVESFYIYITLQ